ncbi:hypothetical protein EYC80_006304 [Monilinia laxa]|uniref:Uncharacterized protein n=1 Tax=Monilinia laxa TaxID=61186 RepID=A0A5N6KH39_MONLA|nr:hypothetical protein EYC80_006304 [Monilinia laxa]
MAKSRAPPGEMSFRTSERRASRGGVWRGIRGLRTVVSWKIVGERLRDQRGPWRSSRGGILYHFLVPDFAYAACVDEAVDLLFV